MNKLDINYLDLAFDILKNGNIKADRTGTGTISVFGRVIRHKMSDGFPLLTTKKMAWKQIVTELLWLLRGETNIKWLVDNGNNIWVGDAYKKYEQEWLKENPSFGAPSYDDTIMTKQMFIEKIKNDEDFSAKWGDLGPIYGKQWRHWEYGDNITVKNGKTYPSGEFMYDIKKREIDQISDAFELLKKSPDSRRIMVTAWNPPDVPSMTLPPCHYGFQFYTRKLSIEERLVLIHAIPNFQTIEFGVGEQVTEEHMHIVCDSYEIPQRALSLSWNQRSVDVPLGLPFNIASYGLLLTIYANQLNMVPEEIIAYLGDTHVYTNQVTLMKEQIERHSFNLPKVIINSENWKIEGEDNTFSQIINRMKPEDFILTEYASHSKIDYPLSN